MATKKKKVPVIESPVKVININLVKKDSALKAFADVTVNGIFMKGWKVAQGPDGLFTSAPATKDATGAWRKQAEVNDPQTRACLSIALINSYQAKIKEKS